MLSADLAVAFPLGNRTPEELALVFNQAMQAKATDGETPAAFGMADGSPVRFAGQRLVNEVGFNGQFGAQARDNKGSMPIREWATRLAQGPFSPLNDQPNKPQEAV